jgi:hypothetical protein
MPQMEKEWLGEEFSICSAVFFWGIRGGIKLTFFGKRICVSPQLE